MLSILSLPRLTVLLLASSRTPSTRSRFKDLLSRLTYLRLGGSFPPIHSFRTVDFPHLQLFQLDRNRIFHGSPLSEFPNLPIQQIDILILSLLVWYDVGSGAEKFDEWSASLHRPPTEARESKCMPNLKRAILEEKIYI